MFTSIAQSRTGKLLLLNCTTRQTQVSQAQKLKKVLRDLKKPNIESLATEDVDAGAGVDVWLDNAEEWGVYADGVGKVHKKTNKEFHTTDADFLEKVHDLIDARIATLERFSLQHRHHLELLAGRIDGSYPANKAGIKQLREAVDRLKDAMPSYADMKLDKLDYEPVSAHTHSKNFVDYSTRANSQLDALYTVCLETCDDKVAVHMWDADAFDAFSNLCEDGPDTELTGCTKSRALSRRIFLQMVVRVIADAKASFADGFKPIYNKVFKDIADFAQTVTSDSCVC